MAETSIGATGFRSYTDYVEAQKKGEVREPKQDLGKDDFLLLLSKQLQYQDPLSPQSDTEFASQLAQYSALEQMTNLNATTTAQYNNDLAGKYVAADIYVNGALTSVFGAVDRVIIKDGESYVQVGEHIFKSSQIVEIYDKDLFMSSNPLVDASNLIGNYIEGKITATDPDDSENTIVQDVSGYVKRVYVGDKGVMYAELDSGESLPVGNIINIMTDKPGTDEAADTDDTATDITDDTDTGTDVADTVDDDTIDGEE